MDTHIITVDFKPEEDALLKKLGLAPDSDEAADFLVLLGRATPLTRPKAALGEAKVDIPDASGKILLGGVEFHSRLLIKNLEKTAVVWPYLATCGRELYDFVQAIPDPFERYWGEEIMQHALTAVRTELLRHLGDQVYPGKTAAMGPGSLAEWPIDQQRPLFKLLGDAAARLGVTLTDTFLMLPNKSISGVFFPNEDGFVNCQLCPREICPNRRAPYDPALVVDHE